MAYLQRRSRFQICKKLLKSIKIFQSYDHNALPRFFMNHSVLTSGFFLYVEGKQSATYVAIDDSARFVSQPVYWHSPVKTAVFVCRVFVTRCVFRARRVCGCFLIPVWWRADVPTRCDRTLWWRWVVPRSCTATGRLVGRTCPKLRWPSAATGR